MPSAARAALLLIVSVTAVAEDRVVVERFDGERIEGRLVGGDASLVSIRTADGVLGQSLRPPHPVGEAKPFKHRLDGGGVDLR